MWQCVNLVQEVVLPLAAVLNRMVGSASKINVVIDTYVMVAHLAHAVVVVPQLVLHLARGVSRVTAPLKSQI